MDQKAYIGERIRELRHGKANMTSDQLGALLDPPRSGKTIISWEHGRTEPDGNTLIQLCIIFGVEISEFYQPTIEYSYIRLDGAEAAVENIDYEKQVIAALADLNEDGRRVAVKVLRCMAFVPEYQAAKGE